MQGSLEEYRSDLEVVQERLKHRESELARADKLKDMGEKELIDLEAKTADLKLHIEALVEERGEASVELARVEGAKGEAEADLKDLQLRAERELELIENEASKME